MRSEAGRGLPVHWIGVETGWRERGTFPRSLVSLPPERLRTHAYVLGRTGSGKTNLLHHLLAQDVLLGHSLVVLDLRGDLVAAALELLAGRRDPGSVLLLDLREKERPAGFDPLFGAGEPYYRALGVLDAVQAESDSWGVQIAETMRHALLLLAETGEPLPRLDALLHDPAFLRGLLGRVAEGPTAAFWRRFLDLSAEKRAGLASPVANKVSGLFATESLRRILGHPRPADLGRRLDEPGSAVLVALAADETHSSGRMLGRIFLRSLLREVFARADRPASARNPVRLYVDEFEHFGEREFEDVLAEGRRFGLSLVLAHQSLAQLAPRARSVVLGNAGCKAVFRCGRDDAAAMSRDLTGDPALLDAASLPVGEAFVWDGSRVARVEVNAPLVPDPGRPSPAARRFAEAVRDRSAAPVEETPPSPVPQRPAARVEKAEPERDAAPSPTLGGSLGGWLS